MTADRTSLAAIAERIAEWESRVAQLRERVERLRSEGTDATQAQEALQVVIRNLTNLYVRQSVMRRTAWAWHSTKAG
jgi:chromosome segregation ATPase